MFPLMKVHSIYKNKKTLSWKRSGNSSWSYFPMFVSQWLLRRWRESEGHLCPHRLLCGNSTLPSVSPLMAPLPSLLPCTTAAVCLNTNLLKSTTDTPSHLPPSLPHIHTHWAKPLPPHSALSQRLCRKDAVVFVVPALHCLVGCVWRWG